MLACGDGRGRDAAAAVEDVSVEPRGAPDVVAAQILLDDVQLHTYIGCMATPSRSYLCYALAARKSARHLSRLYDSHLAPAELSVSQFSILRLLKEHGRLKITQLAL